MNYYSIRLSDHAKTSWVLHELLKSLPSRPQKEGLAPIFYKFFPSADVEVRMKPEYRDLCCKKCGRYDSYKMFDAGFADPVLIRIKGDFGHTSDRVFVISDKFLKALKRARVGGYETKPIGGSGWHALRVTLLVNHREGVVKTQKPICSECGRPKSAFGSFEYLRELSLPKEVNTFFSTTTTWHRAFSDRDLFITEDLLMALKKAGISGGYCVRLLTDEELKKQKAKAKEGVNFWIPPGISVHLNGKAAKK
jgi:hypothetical protein